MQIKKPDERPAAKQGSLPVTEEAARKKTILLGVTVGALGAAAAGAWLWYHGPHLPINTKQNEKAVSPLPPASLIAEAPMPINSEPVKPVVDPPLGLNQPLPINAAKQEAVLKKKAVLPAIKQENQNEFSDDIVLNPSSPPEEKLKVDDSIALGQHEYQYNALTPGPIILVAKGAKIEVSRTADFKKIYVRGTADGSGEFRITNPPPGEIYWRVQGQKKAHKMTISAPMSTHLVLAIPDTLNLGDSFTWTSNANASFYKIQISSAENFSGPIKTFSTKETSMKTDLIGAGLWYVRLAALNLHSGTYDYSNISPLSVKAKTQEASSAATEPTVLEHIVTPTTDKDALPPAPLISQ